MQINNRNYKWKWCCCDRERKRESNERCPAFFSSSLHSVWNSLAGEAGRGRCSLTQRVKSIAAGGKKLRLLFQREWTWNIYINIYTYARRQKENSCVILIHSDTSTTTIHHSLCWILYCNISLASLNLQTCSDTQLILIYYESQCCFSGMSVLVWSMYRPSRVKADLCSPLCVPVRNTTVPVCADQMCRGADTVIRHKIPAALPARGAGCRDYKGSVNEGVITVNVCLHVSPVCSSLLFLLAHHQAPHTHTLRPAFCLPSVIGKCF